MVVTQQMVDDARAAYVAIISGKSVAEVHDANGEIVKYSTANLTKLASYIQFLETQLDVSGPGSGPMRVWF